MRDQEMVAYFQILTCHLSERN